MRTLDNMKVYLLDIVLSKNTEYYEALSIPPPLSQLEFLKKSYDRVYEVAKEKGGFIGGTSVQILFCLAVLLLVVSAGLFLYLLFLLYCQRSKDKNKNI